MTRSLETLQSIRNWISRVSERALPLWIPVLLILLWHIRNQEWPNDDAANYMTTAYDIFDRFRDHGLPAGLVALLDLRGWRPIFFPTLAVPYLLLFHGNIVLAAAGVACTLYCLFSVYVFRLCALFLRRAQATAAAAVVVTSPLICQFATIFFSELAWVCFATIFLYYTLRSEGFKETYYSAMAGGFLGLVLVTRPAESLVVMVIPIALLVGDAVYHRRLRSRDLALTGILLVVSGGLLLGSLVSTMLTRGWSWLIYSLCAACCLAIAARSRGSLSMGYTSFWAASCSISVFWWAGFVRPLYEWAQTTSFGYMAKVTAPPRHGHASPLSMMAEIVVYYGAFQICSLIVLAIAAAFFSWRAQRSADGSAQRLSASGSVASVGTLVCVALGSLLPVFVLYWSSGTGDPRRAMVGVTFLLTALAVTALRAPAAGARVTAPLVVALAVFQLCLLLPGTIGGHLPDLRLIQWSGSVLRPPREQRDLNAQVLDIFTERLPKGSMVAVYTMALFSAPNRVYEPAALQLGAAMRHHSLGIGYLWDEGNYDTVVRHLWETGYRYLLLDSWDDLGVRQSHMPYVHFDAALLDTLRMRDSATPGLRLMDTFPLGGRTQRLFEITYSAQTLGMPPDPKLVAYDGNVAAARNGARAIATNHQTGYPVEFLNDDRETPWGTAEGTDDSYAGVVLPRRQAIGFVRIVLFSPANRAHLRDISIVCADSDGTAGVDWHIVRSRIAGQSAFDEKITVPALPDDSVVDVEIDPHDRNGGPHRIWGIACFSSSRGYRRNYLPVGSGVYVRELQMRQRKGSAAAGRQ